MLPFGRDIGLSQGFAYVPQLGVVGMGGVAAFVAALEHLVGHAQGVADTQHRSAAAVQLCAYPVDGGVAGGADKHLCLALERFEDGFHQGCRLSGAGRTVDDGNVFCTEDFINRILLGAL